MLIHHLWCEFSNPFQSFVRGEQLRSHLKIWCTVVWGRQTEIFPWHPQGAAPPLQPATSWWWWPEAALWQHCHHFSQPISSWVTKSNTSGLGGPKPLASQHCILPEVRMGMAVMAVEPSPPHGQQHKNPGESRCKAYCKWIGCFGLTPFLKHTALLSVLNLFLKQMQSTSVNARHCHLQKTVVLMQNGRCRQSSFSQA